MSPDSVTVLALETWPTNSNAMADLSDATFQLLAQQPAACEWTRPSSQVVRLTQASFAFVEYESRRDADDAYHEMHNKRIGRDDLLKIEVCLTPFKLLQAN